MKTNKQKLQEVTATIVNEMGKVGLFRYNKLTYLFEYFYIKNFGERYTGEDFLKYNHGPVIVGYKEQISDLCSKGIIDINMEKLEEKRSVDDSSYRMVPIYRTEKTEKATTKKTFIRNLISGIVNQFGYLSTEKLEKFVYNTTPMIRYNQMRDRGWKKDAGGYILDNCIRLKDFDTPIVRGRRLALEHASKFPNIDFEQQKSDAKEFSFLKKLRPEM